MLIVNYGNVILCYAVMCAGMYPLLDGLVLQNF